MPRKGPAPRRELLPDPVHRSVVVTQLVNKVLQRGKRSTAERIVYEALEEIERKTGGDPIPTLKRAVENVRPVLEMTRMMETVRAFQNTQRLLETHHEMVRRVIDAASQG